MKKVNHFKTLRTLKRPHSNAPSITHTFLKSWQQLYKHRLNFLQKINQVVSNVWPKHLSCMGWFGNASSLFSQPVLGLENFYHMVIVKL